MDINGIYENAKQNDWSDFFHACAADFLLAATCARYVKPTSGWSFLHQAAFLNNQNAARELIRFGGNVELKDKSAKTFVVTTL